jgi:hypothetical protein
MMALGMLEDVRERFGKCVEKDSEKSAIRNDR